MAATVAGPYFQDFEGYDDQEQDTDFTENNPAGYVVVDDGGNKVLRGRMASAPYIAAGVNIAGSSAQNFTVTTQAQLKELNTGSGASSINMSIAAAGTTSNFGSAEYQFVFDFLDGDIEVRRNGSVMAFTSSSGGASLARAVNTSYTMTMVGEYSSPTSVLLTMTLTDGIDTFTGTFEDNSALTGEHFGYRLAKNGSSTVVGVYFDDYDLNVIPEPSAVALLAGSMGLLVMRRSRR